MSKPRHALRSLLHRLGVAGPARLRAFTGVGAPKISHGTGVSKTSRRLILSVLATAMALCGPAGGLVFASAPAMAKTAHVFSSFFTGSGLNALSEPAGVALNNETGDVYVVDKGHNRVEEFNATGTVVLAEFNGSVGPPQPFSSPEAIAVDNSGSGVEPSKEDVYVTDTGHGVIDKFSSIGVYEGQLTGTCASPGTCPGSVLPFGELHGVAVDPEGNVWVYAGEGNIDEFSDTGSFVKTFNTGRYAPPGLAVDSSDNLYVTCCGERVGKFSSTGVELAEFGGRGTSALAIDSATNELFVDIGSSIDQYGPFGEPFSKPLTTFPSEGLSASDGIAVNANTGTVYATEREAGSVEIFDAVPFPVVGAEPVSNRAVSSVTLNGTVDPEGVEVTSCEFEYGTEAGVYPQKEPCSHALPLTGSAPVPVSANLAGLTRDTTYHYRLVATNADNLTEVTPDKEFLTQGAGISDESAENIESTTATLRARIDPNESETTYHFEYDTSPYTTSAPHGTSLPVPNADIGSGTSPVLVSVALKGLQPGRSYHYRVVAVSELAPGVFETLDGPDETLTTPTTPAPPHSEGCPNEQLRGEQPFAKVLPDCRAYEQASPLDTNGSNAVNRGGETFIRASAKGEAITYDSFGSFAEPTGQATESQYVSRRGPGGWSTQNITPPYDSITTSVTPPYEFLTFTPELSSGITESDTLLTSEATAGDGHLYLADFAKGASASSYQLLLNGGSATNEEQPVVQGASTDLSHVVFFYYETTYEWVDGKAYKVNIAPNGTEMVVHRPVGEAGDFWRSVSDNGLRVFMTSLSTPEQVYVRENPEQEQSPLNGVNGEVCTVPGDACTVEVSASQRTTADLNGPQPALYRGASVEGSRVFFTSRAELTEDAKTGPADNAENLYEYDLEKPAGERLTDLTVDTKDEDGAGVLGVVDISEDGSYVYLVAEGELASNENANKETATPGQPNLYLDHDGATTFIATLSSRDNEDWQLDSVGLGNDSALYTVRETPDGTHLAFLSTKSLTGYDNEQAAAGECEGLRSNYGPSEGGECNEVYEYDADAGSEPLTCASCNPSGARPVGPSGFGEIASQEPYAEEHYTPRNFSEDGSRLFFQSKDTLVPKDSNGLMNVFEYEDGHVYAISDVAGGFASSFLDAGANGDDVFIATADRLLPQDAGLRNAVYDARVDGGYPVSVAPPACDNADACKAPVSPQPAVFGAPASATFSGAGNVAPIVSKPAAKPKPETRAQKLKKALKACKKLKQKTKRLACERQANKRYGPVKKQAKRSSTHSKKGRK